MKGSLVGAGGGGGESEGSSLFGGSVPIVCIGVSNPSKTPLPFFIAKPPLNWQTFQGPI